MPTPPPLYRTKLPSGSPSSARLRKLAPSPVKVPPTPPLYTCTTPFFGVNPSPRTQLYDNEILITAGLGSGRGMKSARSDGREKGEDDYDPFELDFAPLERTALVTSPLEPIGKMYVTQKRRDDPEAPSSIHTHSVRMAGRNASGVDGTMPIGTRSARPRTADSTPPLRVTRQDSTDSNVSIPLLFDARGDFGVLAEKHRLAFSNARREHDESGDSNGIGNMGERRVEVDAPEELDIEWFQSTESGKGPSGLGLGELPLCDSKIGVGEDPFAWTKFNTRARGEKLDIGTGTHVDPVDRPVRVLVHFNDNVFGVNTATSQEVTSTSSSRSLLHPSIINGANTRLGESFASSSSSFSAPDPMSLERDQSLAESNYTFGKPHRNADPISPTQMPAAVDEEPRGRRDSIIAASIFEDDDGWSYTLSAYGDHQDDDADPHTRSSSGQSRSDGVPVPFLSPHVGTTNSPASEPSATPTLFTPNYSIASPNILRTQGHFDDSPSPNDGVSPVFASPLSPKSSLSRRPGSQLSPSLSKVSSASVRSDLALSSTRAASTVAGRKRGYTHGAETPVPVRVGNEVNMESIDLHQTRPTNTGSVDVKPKVDSFPELVRQALRSVPKTTTVTLMIDQEGHREILTTMNHKTVQKPEIYREREIKSLEAAAMWCESPSRPEMFQQTGCVKFTGPNERKRPEWVFHHAALEHLPVLRRITVDQDEKHDYISRGATLQIRDVGVYAVYGYEDKGRVEWKFEYLVQESTSKSTGEVKPNEKKVIPLAFYASPTFFNPDRALKLNLLNVFKKQLTPNIVSEKVKPPRIGKPPPPSSVRDIEPAPVTGTTNAVSRTFGAIAKAVGSRTGTPTTAETFGSKAATEKKGRKRAATLFNRTRPVTPATTQNTPVPTITSAQISNMKRAQLNQHHWLDTPSPANPSNVNIKTTINIESNHKSLKPMKSLSALAAKQDKQRPSTAEPATYPGGRRGLVPMKSLSALHPTATNMGRPRTAEPMPRLPIRPNAADRGGCGEDQRGMTLRSSHPFATAAARPATLSGATHPIRPSPQVGFGAASPLASLDVNIVATAEDVGMWKPRTKNSNMDDPFAKLGVTGDMERRMESRTGAQIRSRTRGRPYTAEPAI